MRDRQGLETVFQFQPQLQLLCLSECLFQHQPVKFIEIGWIQAVGHFRRLCGELLLEAEALHQIERFHFGRGLFGGEIHGGGDGAQPVPGIGLPVTVGEAPDAGAVDEGSRAVELQVDGVGMPPAAVVYETTGPSERGAQVKASSAMERKKRGCCAGNGISHLRRLSTRL